MANTLRSIDAAAAQDQVSTARRIYNWNWDLQTSVESRWSPCPASNWRRASIFDGFLCNKTGQIILQIGQNVDSAEVLWNFAKMLGGTIYCQSSGTGTAKALLSWKARGDTARYAASMLGSAPSMKQAQLQIAARGIVAEASRTHMSHCLKFLKQKEHRPDNFQCSWSYLAGFFDAEGSITVVPHLARLHIELWQMNKFVLEAVLQFLHAEDSRLRGWVLYETTRSPKLICTNLETCKLTLEYLLNSGLRVKKQQAELALSLHSDSYKEVRQAMFQFKGWQGRYSRLDDEGVKRSKEIHRLQNQVTGSKSKEQSALLKWTKCDLHRLQEEHALQRMMSKCRSLRVDMRKSLGQGAYVSPCWNSSSSNLFGPQWPQWVLPPISFAIASRQAFRQCSRCTSYRIAFRCGHPDARSWQEKTPKRCMLPWSCWEFCRT